MRSGSTGSPDVSAGCRQRDGRPSEVSPSEVSPPEDSEPEVSEPRDATLGFSLIEVVMAMFILALSLTTIYPAFNAALTNIGRVDDHVRARELAQSILDEQTARRSLRLGTVRGEAGPYTWVLTVRLADPGVLVDRDASQWRLHELAIDIGWPPQRHYRLSTLHLAHS